MQPKYIIGGIVIVVFTVWMAISLNTSMIQYVPIEEAIKTHADVQVKGERLDTGHFDVEKNLFIFNIRSEQGTTMEVVFDGAKPGNFDQATHVVCKGKYQSGKFYAKEILVKCPSKYQEEGVDV